MPDPQLELMRAKLAMIGLRTRFANDTQRASPRHLPRETRVILSSVAMATALSETRRVRAIVEELAKP